MDTSKGLSLFLSYGHDCEEIVLRIKNDLEKHGYKTWFDRADIKAGTEWREEITSGILNCDLVLAFLSNHSLRKDSICLNELSIAVGCKYGRIKTVLLESNIDHLIPSTISNIQYCDMQDWKIQKESHFAFESWYEEKLNEILDMISNTSVSEMHNQLKYLEQMLSPAMWQSRQARELQKNYIERESLKNSIATWLHNSISSKFFIIYGEPGTGKSSILINYHHFNHEAVAIAFCDWKKSGRDKLGELIRSIAFQIATKVASYRTSLIWHLENKHFSPHDMTEEEIFHYLLVNPFQENVNLGNEPCIIIIDAINEFNDKSVNRFAEILVSCQNELPINVKFIISARKDSTITPYFDLCDSYEIDPNDDENLIAIKDYFSIFLKDQLNKYDENEAEQIIDKLALRSEGNFLYAELFANAVLENNLILDRDASIPQGLYGVFHQWFTQIFPNDELYLRSYYTPLSILCATSDPIPLDLMKKIMGWNNIELKLFLKSMKTFLRCQPNIFGKETATLFHSSMRHWLLSDKAGVFQIDFEDGIEVLIEQLTELFESESITPYQCKILISVLEQSKNDVLRKRIYGSNYFFEQYYKLAKEYETVRNGYHKAILIYIHLNEICVGLPSSDNAIYLSSIIPYSLGKCYSKTGDYFSAKKLLVEHLSSIETNMDKSSTMETYYILGSVYEWLGDRNESINFFEKLHRLATEANSSSYLIKALIGLIWNDHFNSINSALPKLVHLENNTELSEIDQQMCELVKARIMLTTGELNEALEIYEHCLLNFDFAFNNDISGYRKNRLMLIEILPACYDNGEFEKGIRTGELILKKIKNTGWLDECYCSSWISMNFLGLGDISGAQKYLNKAWFMFEHANDTSKSNWILMHLTSVKALLSFENGMYEDAIEYHKQVVKLSQLCDDAWVEGDANFEIAKIYMLFLPENYELGISYLEKLDSLAHSSNLEHLKLKCNALKALYFAQEEDAHTAEYHMKIVEDYLNSKTLPSTNYLDIYCIKILAHKIVNDETGVHLTLNSIVQLADSPQYRNRRSTELVIKTINSLKNSYQNFGIEYCDPFSDEHSSNHWMKLEHLGRYLWASKVIVESRAQIVADIACATGYGSNILKENAKVVYGFDRNEKYISIAQKNYSNISFVCSDIDNLNTNQYINMFDMIICFETIEHVKYPEKLIQTFYSLLKSNGTLLLSFPNALYEKLDENGNNKDKYHLHIFEKNKLARMLDNGGFNIQSILGQSYCNIRCQAENKAIKEGQIASELLEQRNKCSKEDLVKEALRSAIPNEEQIDDSYSYIIHCVKH